MKRVLSIQDISCLGKCSQTVALPLISAMGVETVMLPTALLSTHTMFKNFTVLDLSDQIVPITDHWKSEGIRFDAIYTGYLGTEEEIDVVMKLIEDFRTPETVVFVDPAMGDNGKLYPAFNEAYAKKNAYLCGIADVIVLNITEAAFMTGMEYKEKYDEAYVKELIQKLTKLGAKISVLTGVSLKEGQTGVMGYDAKKDSWFSYQNEKIARSYHGTGDIFSSVSIGGLMNDLSLKEAFRIAADFTAETIRETMADTKEPWYGVNFETMIPELVRMLAESRRS